MPESVKEGEHRSAECVCRGRWWVRKTFLLNKLGWYPMLVINHPQEHAKWLNQLLVEVSVQMVILKRAV